MYSYTQLHNKVNEVIKGLKFPSEPPELYDPIIYTLSNGGKRLRPVMTLMACDLFGGELEKAINPAIGLEMFHNFTLLHDDIMDKAPIRRGQPTVYKKWNPGIAILSGDTMFAIAFELFTEADSDLLVKILQLVSKTAAQVCEGQQFDLNFETQSNVSIDDYLNMIRLKTAVLFATSLKIGAIIGRSKPEEAQNIYHFGENLGLAFQLMDDLLDVYADEDKFGKKRGGDILDNKKTFLYLKALEIANDQTRSILVSNFSSNDMDPDIKIKTVAEIYNQLNIRAIVNDEIMKYYSKSMEFLRIIDVDDQRKSELIQLSKKLIKRDH